MVIRIGGWRWLAVIVALSCRPVFAQSDAREVSAYVTIASGKEVFRQPSRISDVPSRESEQIEPGEREKNQIEPGESVRTGASSKAMLVLPGYQAIIYLEPSSELGLVRPPTERSLGVYVVVYSGRATVVRATSAAGWMVISGAPNIPKASSFALTQNATVSVEVRGDSVSFTGVKGKAWHGVGALQPDRVLLDPSGKPVGLTPIDEGKQVVTPVPAAAAPPAKAGVLLPPEASRVVAEFGRFQSVKWVESAEEGDFTPMRGAGRELPGLLQPSELVLKYDQPRAGTPRAPSRTGFAVVQRAANPAQTLAESSFPGTAVAARRFLGARVVGSSASGALVFNRFAELPFTLAGH